MKIIFYLFFAKSLLAFGFGDLVNTVVDVGAAVGGSVSSALDSNTSKAVRVSVIESYVTEQADASTKRIIPLNYTQKVYVEELDDNEVWYKVVAVSDGSDNTMKNVQGYIPVSATIEDSLLDGTGKALGRLWKSMSKEGSVSKDETVSHANKGFSKNERRSLRDDYVKGMAGAKKTDNKGQKYTPQEFFDVLYHTSIDEDKLSRFRSKGGLK